MIREHGGRENNSTGFMPAMLRIARYRVGLGMIRFVLTHLYKGHVTRSPPSLSPTNPPTEYVTLPRLDLTGIITADTSSVHTLIT
ncbi:hypothetical protein J6590_046049 [Homalodisca vitripennis]|nr:hypothetical protein J6590_046049 [Homalodisca vitripennis]